MKRRAFISEFITLVGSAAAAWPLAARAQQPKLPLVASLTNTPQGDPNYQQNLLAFTQALQQLGWTEGVNIRIERHSTGGKPYAPFAADLVRRAPKVILVGNTPTLAALKRASATIPIVFANLTDPIGQGFVASLAKPEGNITGFMNFEQSMGGKWVEMLQEISPAISQVVVISNKELAPQTEYFIPSIETAARELSLEPVIIRVRDDSELTAALAGFSGQARRGLVVPPGVDIPSFRSRVIESMARYRIPAIYWSRVYTTEGGLVAYGSVQTDLYRRAASYVDRILRGAKPADLPVQTPTKFELAINLKTAKALGLTVPPSLLARADEVIE